MIEIFPDGHASCNFGEAYSHSGKFLGRFIIPITSRLRAHYGLKGIEKTNSHLDIGCGDCLFLKRSPCKKRIGLDLRYGDEIVDHLDFPDGSFENVSMLTVLEHIPEPRNLIREIHRVLKPDGNLILLVGPSSVNPYSQRQIFSTLSTSGRLHLTNIRLVFSPACPDTSGAAGRGSCHSCHQASIKHSPSPSADC